MLFDGKVIIPEDPILRWEIIQRYHDNPAAGHPGEQEMYRKEKGDVYWPGMNTFIWNYVKGCGKCQQYKINWHPTKPLLQPINAPATVRPFSQIAMDLITDIPPSKTWDRWICDSILSIVDHGLSKGGIFIPTTKTATSTDICSNIPSPFLPEIWITRENNIGS